MNEEFRKRPPVPLAPVPFNLPNAVSNTLSCGLRVVSVEDGRQPLVSLRLLFGSGDIHDPSGGIGVSSAVASLLNEGTQGYSSRELAEATDRLGASLSAVSASDHTVVKASSLSMFASELMDLFAEIVLRPTFPESEVELYKQNAIEGLKYQRSQPDFLAEEQVARIVYGDHPYSIHAPTPKDVDKLNRPALEAFHAANYVPNNAVLVAVGDIGADALCGELEKRFSGWASGEIPESDFPAPPERSERSLTLVDRPGSSQANIVLSNLAIDRRSPDYFPVLVMNQVLGAGASSRLFMNLREEKGYTYGAYSRIYARRFGGSFEATAEVRTAVTGDSLHEFFSELERIRNESVGEAELNDAKNFLTGVFPIRVETQAGLVAQLSAQQIYGLPDDYLETYAARIRSVNDAEVMAAAQKYIQPESLAIVIVGDAREVLKQASKYAEKIEVFDSESKPKDPGTYLTPEDEGPADVAGEWKLEVNAQGQELHLRLEIKQTDEGLSGSIDSMLGQGNLEEVSVTGPVLKGRLVTETGGQEISIDLTATVSGDSMEGLLILPMMPDPLPFKGNRE